MNWMRIFGAALAVSMLSVTGIAAAQTEIVYWDFIKPGDGTPRGTALARNLEKFQAKYPDIKVKVEVQPPSQIDPGLIQGTAAGRTPDVVRIDIHYLPRHVAAGSIQPLDKYIVNIDKNDWLLPWTGTVFDGKKFAMPYEYRFSALLYRKDILDKAGVKVPTTWDEMCTAAGKINSPQVMGYAFGLAQTDSANVLLEWFENVVTDAGGKLFDDKGRAIFNDAAGQKFFQTIADLAGKCNATGKAAVEFNYNAVGEGLATGTIAMANLGTHRFLAIRAQGAKENLQWAPPVTFTKGKSAPIAVTGWNLVMGAKAKNPDAAWKFIEFMTSPEAQVNLAQGGELPTRKSTYNDPWLKTPDAKFLVEWSDYVAKNGFVLRYPPTWFNFGQLLAEATQGVVLKGVPPNAALTGFIDKYNKSVDAK